MNPSFTRFALLLLALSVAGLTRNARAEELLSQAELMRIEGMTANHAIVGIGEAIHFTDTWQALGIRIQEHLIVHGGFRLVGIESPLAGGRILDRYVQRGKCGNGPSAWEMKQGIFGAFRSERFRGFLRWICEFNRAHPGDEVRVFGFDVQPATNGDLATASETIDVLREVLPRIAPRRAAELLAEVRDCADKSNHMRGVPLSEARSVACERGIRAAWRAVTDSRRAENRTVGRSREDVAWARIALRSLDAFRVMMTEFAKGESCRTVEARDRGMAENITRVRELFGRRKKTLLYAAVGHLFYRNPEMAVSGFQGCNVMGTYLKRDRRAPYFMIGLTAGRFDLTVPTPFSFTFPRTNLEGEWFERGAPTFVTDTSRMDTPAGAFGPDWKMVPRDQLGAIVYTPFASPMRPSRN